MPEPHQVSEKFGTAMHLSSLIAAIRLWQIPLSEDTRENQPYSGQSVGLSRGNSGFVSRLVLLSKALYHACFICGQRYKWWSRWPKLTSLVISDVKPIIYIYIYISSFGLYQIKVYHLVYKIHKQRSCIWCRSCCHLDRSTLMHILMT